MKIQNLSLAEIVTSRPEAASVLENYNLDFCCRGKLKLAEALKDDADKLKEVSAQLENLFRKTTAPEISFSTLSLTKLADHIIEKHHGYVKQILPVILKHLEKVALKHSMTHPELLKIKSLFEELKRDFEHHMMKEETVLFPRIKKAEAMFVNGILPNENLQGPVHMMEFEHEVAGNIMEEIKILSRNFTPPLNACMTFQVCFNELKIFESDLHQHVHLENNILFPKALKLQNELNQSSYSCSI